MPKPHHEPQSSKGEGDPNLSGPTTTKNLFFMCVFPKGFYKKTYILGKNFREMWRAYTFLAIFVSAIF